MSNPTFDFDEFLERVPKTGWYLTRTGRIRRKVFMPQCPVSSLEEKSSLVFTEVAKHHGIPYDSTFGIAWASDNIGEHSVRTRLIETLKPRWWKRFIWWV